MVGRGRQKIEVKLIENKAARLTCFSKRRVGLFKKARELTVLCGASVGALAFSPAGKPMPSDASALETLLNFLCPKLPSPPQVALMEASPYANSWESAFLEAMEGKAPPFWWETVDLQSMGCQDLLRFERAFSEFREMKLKHATVAALDSSSTEQPVSLETLQSPFSPDISPIVEVAEEYAWPSGDPIFDDPMFGRSEEWVLADPYKQQQSETLQSSVSLDISPIVEVPEEYAWPFGDPIFDDPMFGGSEEWVLADPCKQQQSETLQSPVSPDISPIVVVTEEDAWASGDFIFDDTMFGGSEEWVLADPYKQQQQPWILDDPLFQGLQSSFADENAWPFDISIWDF